MDKLLVSQTQSKTARTGWNSASLKSTGSDTKNERAAHFPGFPRELWEMGAALGIEVAVPMVAWI
jgi:hypothetical protein